MDISDRIESEDSLDVPEHLVVVVEEWIAELIRRACELAAEIRDAVTEAVHIQDAFAARSLTPHSLPSWPRMP
ncbi:hypothetical protein DSM104299_00247 [Baekduia alba]|uniref:hypothetical protein n=1 Tax=Baekduia alba TaxID=2997333 RepID=UPI0023407BBF|nr:hypothetical protein [Baekduia alba]WCB91576.1 hypothetical protein DSM104299_00247 [Baekduia alba]